MKIIKEKLSLEELKRIAAGRFGEMVKAVVDVEQEIIALDAELHSDLEALLLQEGSKQENLWGINFYPLATENDFLEFDSMINVRPSRANRSRGVENEETRRKIAQIVAKRFPR